MEVSAVNPLNAHEWLYGLTECFHILGFALAIGSVSLVDLHLAGWGFSKRPTADIVRETALWTIGGIAVATLSGLMILSTDPVRYLNHPAILAKLIAFVVAIIYNYSVHTSVARGTPSPGVAWAVAALSLLLWTSVVYGGLFYSFT